MPTAKGRPPLPNDASSLFRSPGVVHRLAQYPRSAVIFAQGADCTDTRARDFFMNKFRKLGFIDYNGGIQVKPALLSVVLHS